MKHRILILLAMLALAVNLSSGQQVAKALPLPELLEKAIFTEETVGDLDAAMELYEQIVARTDADRSYGAQAQYRLALCFLKKGNSDEAVAAFRKLVGDFPKQEEIVARARARLTELGHPVSATTIRQVWSGPQVDTSSSVSLDGRALSYRAWHARLAIHDLTTGRNRTLTGEPQDWWGGVEGSTVSPDGRHIAYAWRERGRVELRIIGLDGSEPRTLLAKESARLEPTGWSSNGSHILAAWQTESESMVIALVAVADGAVRILKTLQGGRPLGVSLSPDGRYVAYDYAPVERGHRDIFLLPTAGGEATTLVAHAASDFHPVWTPDGKGVLFLSDRGGSLGAWRIAAAEGKPHGSPMLVKPDTGPIVPMGFTRDGSFYYRLLTRSENVYVATLDAASGQAVSSPTVAIDHFVGRNASPAWSPDGRHLAYLSQRTSENLPGAWLLVIRSIETGDESEFTHDLHLAPSSYGRTVSPYPPTWSPDGKLVLVGGWDQHGGQGLYTVDIRAGEVAPIVKTGVHDLVFSASWSRDGKSLVYEQDPSDDRCVVVRRNLETGEENELIGVSSPRSIDAEALSPDGRRLALLINDWETVDAWSLQVMPADGGEPRELLRLEDPEYISGVVGLVWTPDGRELLFGTGVWGSPERTLWRIPAAGGERKKLGVAMEGLGRLSIHPDGSRIAFSAGSNNAEVWAMENFLPKLGGSTVSEVRP